MSIRVLRIMEYEFPDYETMERTMEHLSVPLNGKIVFGESKIRSASVDIFEKDDEDGNDSN